MAIADFFPGMEQLQMVQNLMGTLDTAFAMAGGLSSHIIGQIAPFVNGCLTIYVIGYGLLLMSGSHEIKGSMHDVGLKIFKLVLVVQLALNAAAYNTVLIEYVLNFPEDLVLWLLPDTVLNTITNFLAGILFAGEKDGPSLLILLLSTLMSSIVALMDSTLHSASAAGVTDLPLQISGIAIGVTGAGLTAITIGTLMVAKVSLAVMLAVGPIFFPAILFDKTKHLFDGWVNNIINFILVIFLLTIVVYLLFPVLLGVVAVYYSIGHLVGLKLGDSAELAVLFGIFIAIIKQVPSMAASMSRGYAVGATENPGQTSKQAGQ